MDIILLKYESLGYHSVRGLPTSLLRGESNLVPGRSQRNILTASRRSLRINNPPLQLVVEISFPTAKVWVFRLTTHLGLVSRLSFHRTVSPVYLYSVSCLIQHGKICSFTLIYN